MFIFDPLINWFWRLVYSITHLFAYIMEYLYEAFEMVAGLSKISYGDKQYTLLEAFFQSSTLTKFYWNMAIVGVSLTFFFTILAVVKKMFDSSDKVKQTLGGILGQGLKSILLILGMNLLMTCVIYFSTEFIHIVSISFESAYKTEGIDTEKKFTDAEYAQMANVLNTIGNYSLNPSYNSRYNLNSCYNAIRSDLANLSEEGLFDVQYVTPDPLSGKEHYWQETLQKILNAAPDKGETDLKLDVYNKDLADAIMNAMDQVQNNNGFIPLDKYKQSSEEESALMKMDRLVLLLGTLESARNSSYNGKDAQLNDSVRAPYYYGYDGSDVHDAESMEDTFYLNTDYKYVMVWFLIYAITKSLIVIIFNCVARIFNMAILYIAAPPVIAVAPFDDGGKLKQWMTAFIVQTFGVLGTILGMYMILIFVPFIMNSDLVFFENSTQNFFLKFMIIWGAFETAKKASGMITGILADSAGWQSVQAGDMSNAPKSFKGALGSMAKVTGLPQLAGMQKENIAKAIQSKLPFGKSGEGGSSGEKDKADSGEKAAVSTPDSGGEGGSGDSGGGSDGGGSGGGGGNSAAVSTPSSSGGSGGGSGSSPQNLGDSQGRGGESQGSNASQNQGGGQGGPSGGGGSNEGGNALQNQSGASNGSNNAPQSQNNGQNQPGASNGSNSSAPQNQGGGQGERGALGGNGGSQSQGGAQVQSGALNGGNAPQNQGGGQGERGALGGNGESQSQSNAQGQGNAPDGNSNAVQNNGQNQPGASVESNNNAPQNQGGGQGERGALGGNGESQSQSNAQGQGNAPNGNNNAPQNQNSGQNQSGASVGNNNGAPQNQNNGQNQSGASSGSSNASQSQNGQQSQNVSQSNNAQQRQNAPATGSQVTTNRQAPPRRENSPANRRK